MDTSARNTVPARRVFSRIGLAMSVILLLATGIQLLLGALPGMLSLGEDHWLSSSVWIKWLGTFAPIYLIAIPAGLMIMRKLPVSAPENCKAKGKSALVVLPICFFMMYAGNLIGTILSMVLSGGSAQNVVLDYALDTHPLKILFMVILAPLLEEYVCRKVILDRTRVYGEKTAAFLSAIVFGLMHQNLFQFFYAFGLGLIFACVYLRTGRLRYTVLLHSIINFMGAVFAPWVLSLIDLELLATLDPTADPAGLMAVILPMLPGLIIYMLYAMLLMGLAVTGLVFFILRCRRWVWADAEAALPGKSAFRTVYLNAGMLLYILLCLVFFVLALL